MGPICSQENARASNTALAIVVARRRMLVRYDVLIWHRMFEALPARPLQALSLARSLITYYGGGDGDGDGDGDENG